MPMNDDTSKALKGEPIIRSALYDLFSVFDYPDPGMLTGQRSSTTVAPQALFLMNSPFMANRSESLLKRLKAQAAGDGPMLQAAYRSVFGREASAEEVGAAIAFLDNEEKTQQAADGRIARDAAWSRLCQVLLASNEFLYLR